MLLTPLPPAPHSLSPPPLSRTSLYSSSFLKGYPGGPPEGSENETVQCRSDGGAIGDHRGRGRMQDRRGTDRERDSVPCDSRLRRRVRHGTVFDVLLLYRFTFTQKNFVKPRMFLSLHVPGETGCSNLLSLSPPPAHPYPPPYPPP